MTPSIPLSLPYNIPFPGSCTWAPSVWPEKAHWWSTTIAWIHSRSLMRPDLSKLQANTALGRKAWAWIYRWCKCIACTTLRIVCFKYCYSPDWFYFFLNLGASPSSKGEKILMSVERSFLFINYQDVLFREEKEAKKPPKCTKLC